MGLVRSKRALRWAKWACRPRRRVITVLLSAVFSVGVACPAQAEPDPTHPQPRDGAWSWPLDPQPAVVARFEAPDSPWAAGHRGVDLAGEVGERVLSIGSGRVSFVGVIAGVSVIAVDHGALRSTYQPVTPVVTVGESVSRGDVIGLLQSVGSHCAPAACLHLGVLRGTTYLDPLTLLGLLLVRLKPLESGPPTGLVGPIDRVGPVGPVIPLLGSPAIWGIAR
jgi:murein DD-endopeptidase MepM/ murein hydrolase activator NlpD